MPEMFRLAWTQPEMKAGKTDEAEMLLYGQIIQNVPKEYKFDENDTSASDFDKALKAIKKQGAKKLTLRVNSPGGVVFEAVAMRGMLCAAAFDALDIRIEGLCASAATLIACTPGATVTMVPGSQYMIHNPSCIAIGTADDMDNMSHQLRLIEQTSREFYAQKTSQTDEQLKSWMDAETWFSAEEAVKYGFADKISEETPAKAVACVSSGIMAAMMKAYTHVPDSIGVEKEMSADDDSTQSPTVAAGDDAGNIHEEVPQMEIKDITLEQLRAENPGLVDTIMQSAAQAERERMQDIDDLTPAGYEEMAAKAKAEGTSSMDYHKAIIKAQREKAAAFIAERKQETAQAETVTACAAEDQIVSDEDQMKSFAAEIAGYAKTAHSDINGMY